MAQYSKECLMVPINYFVANCNDMLYVLAQCCWPCAPKSSCSVKLCYQGFHTIRHTRSTLWTQQILPLTVHSIRNNLSNIAKKYAESIRKFSFWADRLPALTVKLFGKLCSILQGSSGLSLEVFFCFAHVHHLDTPSILEHSLKRGVQFITVLHHFKDTFAQPSMSSNACENCTDLLKMFLNRKLSYVISLCNLSLIAWL